MINEISILMTLDTIHFYKKKEKSAIIEKYPSKAVFKLGKYSVDLVVYTDYDQTEGEIT